MVLLVRPADADAAVVRAATDAQRRRFVALRDDGRVGDAAFQRVEEELDWTDSVGNRLSGRCGRRTGRRSRRSSQRRNCRAHTHPAWPTSATPDSPNHATITLKNYGVKPQWIDVP
jgi:hypothetical protein